MDTQREFQIGVLVESWAYSFGRVVEIGFDLIGVKFCYTAPIIYYTLESAKRHLKIHEG